MPMISAVASTVAWGCTPAAWNGAGGSKSSSTRAMARSASFTRTSARPAPGSTARSRPTNAAEAFEVLQRET